jgi:hypothetical protein
VQKPLESVHTTGPYSQGSRVCTQRKVRSAKHCSHTEHNTLASVCKRGCTYTCSRHKRSTYSKHKQGRTCTFSRLKEGRTCTYSKQQPKEEDNAGRSPSRSRQLDLIHSRKMAAARSSSTQKGGGSKSKR